VLSTVETRASRVTSGLSSGPFFPSTRCTSAPR
jgi:hypothetical protein